MSCSETENICIYLLVIIELGHCNTSGVWPGVSVGKTSKAACSAPSGIKGTKFRKW